MSFLNRMLRGLLATTVLLATLMSLSADWLFEHGDFSARFRDCITLLEAYSKYEQLSEEAQSTFKRIQVKGRIAEALRNREITLIDAAAYFRSLHEDPKTWHHNHPRPDLKDGEGWCREVIEWTMRNSYSSQPSSQIEALRQRLETELQEQRERRGTLSLPL